MTGEVEKSELGALQKLAGESRLASATKAPMSRVTAMAQETQHQAMGAWSKTITPNGTCC